MKIRYLTLVAPVLVSLTPAQTAELTLRQTLEGSPEWVVFYAGVPPVEWAPDGKHLIAPAGGGRKVWLDPEAGRTIRPRDGSVERGQEFAAALRELEVGRSDSRAIAATAETAGGAMFASRAGSLYFQRKGAAAKKLVDGEATLREVHAAPGAKHIAFVRDHDLFVVDTASGVERAVTKDGSERLLYGRLDWVYQEELYGRGDFRAHWWSGKGTRLAFLRLDQKNVKPFPIVDYVPDASLETDRGVATETMNYPKAGDPNPIAALGIAGVPGGKTVWVEMPEGYDDEILIPYVGWHADGKRVVFQVTNRVQTWLDLCAADAATGAVTRILRERSKSWVNRLEQPYWLPDGSFLWLSERTGYKHLYHYGAAGKLIRAVTSGEWQINEVAKVDGDSGRVWFTATKDGAINDNLYRTSIAEGAVIARLTTGDGMHKVELNAEGSRFVDEFSSLSQPPELRVCDGDGKVLGTLQKGRPRGRATHEYAPWELLKIPNRDGFEMDAALLKPSDFDANKNYPVFLEAYGGPDTPVFRNQWNAGGSTWHQFLARRGVLVLQVNNRSASGRGQVHTATCYRQFGVTELRDYEDAVAWLTANDWADAARVAISGWSYGGTMAAYALTHSDKFALGFAGAGVYDWRLYDTIYTERYMDRPEANKAGYAASSVLGAVKNLKGHLVVLHGTRDDNVHLQNAMQLVLALQKAGKQFDLMLYPQAQHGVVDLGQRWHQRQLMWRQVREQLLENK